MDRPPIRRAKNFVAGRSRKRKKLSSVTLMTMLIVAAIGWWNSQNNNTLNREASRAPASTEKVKTEKQAAPAAGELQGKVVKVSDGDTITVLKDNKQVKIRLLGIDAPEKKQPFGQACRENLANMIAGKDVTVKAGDTDRYGRTIGKIVYEGRDINLAQVEAGCAWHYKQYQKNQPPPDRQKYADAESQARNQKLGLWKQAPQQPPWEFRAASRNRVPAAD